MLFTLKNIQQFQSVFTFQQYLSFIGAEFDQNTIFYQTTLICSDNIPLKKFPIINPSNFLYQKLFEDKKKDENKYIQYSNSENNFQNKKYFLVSQKLILSDEMETFYKIIGEQNIDFILQNFKILIKEDINKETYIQIWGEPIMKNTIKQKSNNQEKICRQQILYCNHMSRQVGLFKKNFISQAKKEIIMRNFIPKEQISLDMISMKATSNIFDQYYFEGKFKEQEKQQLRILTQKLINNMQKFNFPQAFKIFVPLPPNYQNLKKDVQQSIKQKQFYIPNLYDNIYKNFLSYDQVISTLRNFLRTIIPIDFLGQQNLYTFLNDLQQFITLLRFEDQNYSDYINRFNVFQIPWMNTYFSKKKQKILIFKKRQQLFPIFRFLFQQIIIPFLRHNFYITERMKDDWKLFYYRKEIWNLILKLSLNQLSSNNLKQISPQKITTQYIGKLRIVPKPGTFRPIVTYNRKSRISKLSLNKKLLDIKYVLRNLRSQQLGFSVFGNPQIFNRLEEFKKLWIKYQFPQTYFMSMDIHKCYDSIQLEFLLKFIQESNLIQSAYIINKYYLIIRNNRQIKGSKQMRDLFNIFDRTCAIPINNPQCLQKGYIEYIQQNKLAIIANLGIQTTVTFSEFLISIKELCQNNIVQFEDRYFIQTLGIPQGLNISGILCSFYIANIEKNLTRKLIGDTLIMRLTDDYCCLTFDKQNLINIKNNFKEVEKLYSIHLNDDKTQHNIDQKVVTFKWIGKIINLEKLTIKPAFAQEKDSKFSNQINVNLPSRLNSYFFKAKLKSLMLNQFKFFFNPKINDQPTLIKIAKTFIHAGLIKLVNFMEKAKLFKLSKQKNKKFDFLSKIIFQYRNNQISTNRNCKLLLLISLRERIRIRSELHFENNKKVIIKNNKKSQKIENDYQLQKFMNQQFYNFLNIPITHNPRPELVRVRLAKQFIVAQVLHIFNTWKSIHNDESITFGLIGCGQVGKLIINSIIPYAIKYYDLKPQDVHISTRRPEQIHYYVTKGYQVYFDNDKLLQQCNFVVIAIPPMIDNWNILELQIRNPKTYIISLLSTLKLPRLKQLLKLDNQLYHTQISSQQLDQAVLSYIELIEQIKPGVFQTQIQEDIVKLITEQSHNHFIDGENRIKLFLESFGIQLTDNQYQKIFGRNKQEFETQIEKLFKMSFTKSMLQFQNFIQK